VKRPGDVELEGSRGSGARALALAAQAGIKSKFGSGRTLAWEEEARALRE